MCIRDRQNIIQFLAEKESCIIVGRCSDFTLSEMENVIHIYILSLIHISKQEREAGGVLDMDTKVVSTITSHGPGYLNKDKEKIVGFQTDKPFKRALQVYGGIRMAVKACEDNGYQVDPEVVEYFTTHRKTHNAGVFDAYTPEMRACRSAHIITGLPDAYGRGRIIGDYRRVALYGVDRLIEDKKAQKDSTRIIMYSCLLYTSRCV